MDEHIVFQWTVYMNDGTKELRRTYKRGKEARYFIRWFQRLKGSGLREGDIISGCRIEKIGEVDE